MKRWLQLSWRERRVLIAAILATTVARLALLVIPWRRLAVSRGDVPAQVAPAQAIDTIAWAIDVCGRRVPWATCFSNALAARWLLARRGVAAAIELGTYHDETRHFHARVVCGGRAIAGEREMAVLVRLDA